MIPDEEAAFVELSASSSEVLSFSSVSVGAPTLITAIPLKIFAIRSDSFLFRIRSWFRLVPPSIFGMFDYIVAVAGTVHDCGLIFGNDYFGCAAQTLGLIGSEEMRLESRYVAPVTTAKSVKSWVFLSPKPGLW